MTLLFLLLSDERWLTLSIVDLERSGAKIEAKCKSDEYGAAGLLSELSEKRASLLGLAYGKEAFPASLISYSERYTQDGEIFQLEFQVKPAHGIRKRYAEQRQRDAEQKQREEATKKKEEVGFFAAIGGFLQGIGEGIADTVGPGVIAAQLIKKILLNEPTPFETGLPGIELSRRVGQKTIDPLVKDMATVVCPFSDLYQQMKCDPGRFIVVSKLYAHLLLVLHELVGKVVKFDVDLSPQGKIHVAFAGYGPASEGANSISVEGDCKALAASLT